LLWQSLSFSHATNRFLKSHRCSGSPSELDSKVHYPTRFDSSSGLTAQTAIEEKTQILRRSTLKESATIAESDSMPTVTPDGNKESLASADENNVSLPTLIGVIAGLVILALAIAAGLFVIRLRRQPVSSYNVSENQTEAKTEFIHSPAFDVFTGINILTATAMGTDSGMFTFDENEGFFA
jgi:hypothetical protein